MITPEERAKIEKEIKEKKRKRLRAYEAEWRRRNPEKVREKNARAYAKRKAAKLEQRIKEQRI